MWGGGLKTETGKFHDILTVFVLLHEHLQRKSTFFIPPYTHTLNIFWGVINKMLHTHTKNFWGYKKVFRPHTHTLKNVLGGIEIVDFLCKCSCKKKTVNISWNFD